MENTAYIHFQNIVVLSKQLEVRLPSGAVCNTKGYSSTYLAMGFANVRAGTWHPPEH